MLHGLVRAHQSQPPLGWRAAFPRLPAPRNQHRLLRNVFNEVVASSNPAVRAIGLSSAAEHLYAETKPHPAGDNVPPSKQRNDRTLPGRTAIRHPLWTEWHRFESDRSATDVAPHQGTYRTANFPHPAGSRLQPAKPKQGPKMSKIRNVWNKFTAAITSAIVWAATWAVAIAIANAIPIFAVYLILQLREEFGPVPLVLIALGATAGTLTGHIKENLVTAATKKATARLSLDRAFSSQQFPALLLRAGEWLGLSIAASGIALIIAHLSPC